MIMTARNSSLSYSESNNDSLRSSKSAAAALDESWIVVTEEDNSVVVVDEEDENDTTDDAVNRGDKTGVTKPKEEESKEELTMEEKIRKYKTAAAGGALVVIGTILIPVPFVPVGLPTVAAGLHVLGKEFEEAKEAEEKLIKTMQTGKDKIVETYNQTKPQLDQGLQNAKLRMQIINEQINQELGIKDVPTTVVAGRQQAIKAAV